MAPLPNFKNGSEIFKASTKQDIGQASVLVFATGYQRTQLQMNETLQRGKPTFKNVAMKAVDSVQFVLTTANGTPASNAAIETRKSAELRRSLIQAGGHKLHQLLNIDATSDKSGKLTFPSPAFSEWTTYRFQHVSGYLDIRGRDLPRPESGKAALLRRIRLLPFTSIKGTYLPAIGKDEFVEVYRLESDRKTVATRGQRVAVDENGTFHLKQRLAGWHSFVHRVHYTASGVRGGTIAIGSYGPFELSSGQTLELTLGTGGRSVVGRLKFPVGAKFDFTSLRLSVASGKHQRYPVAPQGLNGKESKAWWDSFWDSPKGQQYRRYKHGSVSTLIASDGSFYFPHLPTGKYSLRLAAGSTTLTLGTKELDIPDAGAATTTLDVGEWLVHDSNAAGNAANQLEPSPTEESKWTLARPKMVSTSTGTARVLDDNSVQLGGDVQWQEASLQYSFDKPTTVREIRLEILSVDSPSGRQFGRGGKNLVVFDIIPSVDAPAGTSTGLEFESCSYLQNPEDTSTAGCIDFLTDSGWNVPALPPGSAAHVLVLRLSKPLPLSTAQRLTLRIDSGGSEELAVLNRIRFAFERAKND